MTKSFCNYCGHHFQRDEAGLCKHRLLRVNRPEHKLTKQFAISMETGLKGSSQVTRGKITKLCTCANVCVCVCVHMAKGLFSSCPLIKHKGKTNVPGRERENKNQSSHFAFPFFITTYIYYIVHSRKNASFFPPFSSL